MINIKKIINRKLKREEDLNMSYSELYKIISKPWLNTTDIQKICQCGQKKATNIRNDIEEELKNMGKRLPISSIKVVPTPMLLKYLDIDADYVYSMAQNEMNLNNNTKKEKSE